MLPKYTTAPVDITELHHRVRDLLAVEAYWTKKSYALDKSGCSVSPSSDEVEKVCLYGACTRALGPVVLGENLTAERIPTILKDYLSMLTRCPSLAVFNHTEVHRPVAFNDKPTTTYAMMRKLLDEAGSQISLEANTLS